MIKLLIVLKMLIILYFYVQNWKHICLSKAIHINIGISVNYYFHSFETIFSISHFIYKFEWEIDYINMNIRYFIKKLLLLQRFSTYNTDLFVFIY